MTYTPERSDTASRIGQVVPAGGPMARIQAEPPGGPIIRAAVDGYRCGQCASEDIQKLSMVYESGTTKINARTSGTSTGFGVARGGFGLGTAVSSSRTTGTQTSELAKRAAPPARKLGAGWIALGLIGLLILGAIGGVAGAAVTIGVSGYYAYKGIGYNRDVYPGLRAAWEQSWLCHRCGTVTRIQ